MGWSSVCKLMQKQAHDILSQRYGTLIVLMCFSLLVFSAFQFGEVFLEWSTEKYAAVFNSFSDNLAGKSYRNRLCLPVPIDVVYTWVNGTDPSLLAELNKYKHILETDINETAKENQTEKGCTFANCVPALAAILDPALPSELSTETLGLLYPSLKAASRVARYKSPISPDNVTAVFFKERDEVDAALKESIMLQGANISIKQAYLTSEWTLSNAVLLPDTVLVAGLPQATTQDQLLAALPAKYKPSITQVDIHADKGVAVLHVPDAENHNALTEEKNVTIDGKALNVQAASILWDTHDYSKNEDVSASRFEDNEELRYSLRSIEKHAPWVRHVYLVTNGQIPAWLNLDSPRLTIVTHTELFPNKSHLPTFSSPAIEAHLHRIPGLSDKFIYLNDDVMFGKDVWPDDFYTHAHGQKVYLTWPVPNCQEGCPSTWIRDGYCDKACNNSQCEWDGGDCDGSNPQQGAGFAGANAWQAIGTSETLYCNTGCANNWIADKYCDQSCNVPQCAFDAGDCGIDNFHKLHRMDLTADVHHYRIPKGEVIGYLNLTGVLGEEDNISEGLFDELDAVRSVSIAQKFKVVTIVLHKNHSDVAVNLTLTGKKKDGEKIEFNCTVHGDTIPLKVPELPAAGTNKTLHANDSKVVNGSKPEEKFVFKEIQEDLRSPKAEAPHFVEVPAHDAEKNLSLYELPDDIQREYDQLLEELKLGDITAKGFQIQHNMLWETFAQQLKDEGKVPVKKTIKEAEDDVKEGVPPVAEDNKGQGQGQDVQEGVQEIDVKPRVESLKHAPEGPQAQEQMEIPARAGDAVHQHQAEVEKVKDEKAKDAAAIEGAADKGVEHEDPVQVRMVMEHNNQKALMPDEHKPDAGEGDAQVAVEVKDAPKQPAFDSYLQEKAGKVIVRAPNTSDPYKVDQHKSRNLNAVLRDQEEVEAAETLGLLPWEKEGIFDDLQKKSEALERQKSYTSDTHHHSRRLLDTFGDSLRHVNRLYNKKYGYTARKVPAHMPHMIDRHIMAELQSKFPHEWDVTSSHHIRSSTDMQYAFSYFYYLMGEPHDLTVGEVFDEMDMDHSGVLSDREIRTLATRLYELPLDLQTLTGLESKIINCSKHLRDPTASYHPLEKYYEKEMPQVTRYLIQHCGPVQDLMMKSFKGRTKHKFEIVGEDEVAFKMVRTNVSHVVGQLDDIRKHPKKFICLNDNIDHKKEEAKTVKAVLQDFYESIFPIPSSFELPREYRNRFLHVDELREWRRYRDWLKWWTQLALFFLIIFTVASFFSDKIEAMQKKFSRRRTGASSSSSSSSSRGGGASGLVEPV